MTRAARPNPRSDEDVVFAVPEPPFTDTWHPVSHRKVGTAVMSAVAESGMEIVEKNYSLSQEGLNAFATYTLSEGNTDSRWMVGWRNSMCKKFPVGLAAGDHVYSCSNMMFSGKFLEFRKHTSGMGVEVLAGLASSAVGKLIPYLTALAEWHEGLKEVEVSTGVFKQISFDLLFQGAIAPSKFMTEFIPAYQEEQKTNGDSLYTVHGAVTRTVRNASLFNISDRTAPLNRVIDVYNKKLVAA